MKTAMAIGLAALILIIPATLMAYSVAAFVAVFQMINWSLFLWVAGGLYAVMLTILALQLSDGI